MPGSKISSEAKGWIFEMREGGMTLREIVEKSGASLSTVTRLLRKIRQEGFQEGIKNKPVPGRPTIWTPHILYQMKRFIEDHPFSSASDVKSKCLSVSHLSIRRIQEGYQKKFKMPVRRAAKKPLLKPNMVEKRLAFAHNHFHWTEEDWLRVMFTDESTFQLFRNRIKLVRRPVKQ